MLRHEGRAYMTCVSMFEEEGIPEREAARVCARIINVVKQRYGGLEVARDPQIAEKIAEEIDEWIRSKHRNSLLNKLGREKLTGITLKMTNTKTNYEILKEGLNLIGTGVSLVSLIKMAYKFTAIAAIA